eukprot:UN34300
MICLSQAMIPPYIVVKIWRWSEGFGDFWGWFMAMQYGAGLAVIIYSASFWVAIYRLIKEYHGRTNQIKELNVVDVPDHGQALEMVVQYPFNYTSRMSILLDKLDKNKINV